MEMRFSAFILIAVSALSNIVLAQNGVRPVTGAVSTTNAQTSPFQHTELKAHISRYELRAGDSFELQFAFSPEFNQTVSVQPDGYITLKAIGTISAEGATVPELTQRIERAYSGMLRDPIITVELKDVDKPYFVAAGQVGKPGKYDLRSDLTVVEGVAIAGGFTSSSKHSQLVLFRPLENGVTEAHVIDVKKMLASHNLKEDIHLLPGDIIYVPQNWISKISRYLPTSSLGLYGNPLY
jgi:polysaccharide biosynthesis/export protein